MQYPLSEIIGDPTLLVGRENEFDLLNGWLELIPRRLGKSRVLSAYFDGVQDKTKLNITEVCMRYKFQRSDEMEMEIDVLAESDCGRTVLTEVKKTKEKIGIGAVREFHEKTAAYSRRFPKKTILPAFLSVGGFTRGAAKFCREKGISTAERIAFFQEE